MLYNADMFLHTIFTVYSSPIIITCSYKDQTGYISMVAEVWLPMTTAQTTPHQVLNGGSYK